jgi:hypothetical protein
VAGGYWLRTNGLWSWQTEATNSFGLELWAASRGVSLSVVNTVTNLDCINGFTATRTWQAVDTCGHAVYCSQTVQLVDGSLPIVLSVEPSTVMVEAGETAVFNADVFSCSAAGYHWYYEGTNAVQGASGASLVLSNVSLGMAGLYAVVVSNASGSVTSAPVQLMVAAPPSILSGPTDTVATNGDTVEWMVQADGTGPLTYQWYFDGTNALPGQTDATLALSNVNATLAGDYLVVVSNTYGSVTSAPANLTVLFAPTILSQPQNQNVLAGDTAVFTVSATGLPEPSYQWVFNGTNILSGQTAAILTLGDAQDTAAGNYSVLVSNMLGSVASLPASLTVLDGPIITVQPQSVTCTQGQTILLTVQVSGTSPFSYQWYADCQHPISGATDSNLRLKQVTPEYSGSYCVTISNAYGHAVSQGAMVRVLTEPSLISFVKTQAGVELTFSTVTNLLYSVEYSDQLRPLPWTLLPDAVQIPGTGQPITVTDTNALGTSRFYRILVQ